MMTPYYFSLSTAALTFPLVSFLASLPYAIYSYRSYGSISVWRTIVLFSFAFYLQCAYFLVILPLPDPATVAASTGPFDDLHPFSFLTNFLRETPFKLTQPGTWLATLTSRSFLEPLFNFLLLLPFGVYLAYYFRQNWKIVLLLSFLLSLFFELSQLTGLFGLYPKPYRLFATDDLLLNTLGGLAGFFIFARVLRFLPKRERIDEKSRERGTTVSYFRRLVALLIDSVFVSIPQALLSLVLHLEALFAFALALCVYTIGLSLLLKGRTVGKALVRIKVVTVDDSWPFALAITLRYLPRNALLLAFFFLNEHIATSTVDQQLLWLGLYLGTLLLVLIDLLINLRIDRRLLYERLSRTKNLSTVPPKAGASGASAQSTGAP
jgi:glycopeptide antibiotics resistance protein